nr:MAG TPA: hypothetical protein [Caudoviricetes sp.]
MLEGVTTNCSVEISTTRSASRPKGRRDSLIP